MKDRLLRVLFGLPIVRRLMWAFVARSHEIEPFVFGRAVTRHELSGPEAHYLGWATGHEGRLAAAGLWINHPVAFDHQPGSITVGSINERIVEIPFVFASLADLPTEATILDIGSSESTVGLSLASMGYRVTCLDLRGYPFDHPNLRRVSTRIEEWEGPVERFDAIVSLSTLEHLGLGSYGQDSHDPDLDVRLMQVFRNWLVPGGRLILTAPFGEWKIDEFERTYDDDHLAKLVAGWRMDVKEVFCKIDDHWLPLGEGVTTGEKQVVAMVLRNPG